MTEKEAIFLKEEFENNALGLILKGRVLDTFYEAERMKQQEAVFLKEEFEKKAQGLILKGKVL
jgi:hypothetical protein